MFCTKCGKENEDGAKFCNGCGATFESPVTPVAPVTPVVAPAPASTEATAPAPQQPKKKTGLIIGIVAAVVAVIAIVIGVLFATGVFGGDSSSSKKKNDKDDKKSTIETTAETTTEETTTETTTEAPTVYGLWETTQEIEESGMKATMTFELEIKDDGSYEIVCTDYTVDKDSFVAYVVDGIEAELTDAEIQEFLDMYGYDSLEDYASEYYDEEIPTLVEQYEGEVIESGDDFESNDNYVLDGDTLTLTVEGKDLVFTRK